VRLLISGLKEQRQPNLKIKSITEGYCQMTLEEIRERIVEMQEQMQAVIANAEDLNRELTEDEGEEIDAILEEIENKLRPREARMEKVEAEKQRIALAQKPAVEVQASTSMPAVPKSHRKLRAFDSEQDAYRAGLWFKASFLNDKEASRLCNDYGILNTAVEGTDSLGGYLVPTELSAAIEAVRSRGGVARQLCKIVGMGSDVLNIPKLSAGLTVDYPAEAAAITASDQTWAQISLSCKKRAIVSKVANELLHDSVISVIDDLAVAVGNAFAVREDAEFILGDGTSAYGSITGLVEGMGAGGTVDMASGKTAFSDITLADLNSLVGNMPDKYYGAGEPAWLISRLAWASNIQSLVYAAGGNTLSDLASGAAPQLFGFPVYLSDSMPVSAVSTYAAFFGAFRSAAVIGDRMGIDISVSEEAYWANDITAIKGVTRYDIQVHDIAGSDAGAVSGLKTAAS
jgi:HK97 family phage major capsid protein